MSGKISSTDLNVLTSLGATMVPITMPSYPVGGMLSIMAVEAATVFDDLTRSGGLNLLTTAGGDFATSIRAGHMMSAVDYLQAQRVRTKLINDMARIYQSVDLCVMPYAQDNNLAAANLCGLPCVAVPHGNGTSLLFVGNLFEEGEILQAAKAYQNATPYLEHPPLFRN